MNTLQDYYLASLKPELRRVEEAMLILSNSDADKAEIQEAIYLLTKDKELQEVINAVEIYRKYGFSDKIQELFLSIEGKLNDYIAGEKFFSEEYKRIIYKRFKGIPPSKKIGKARNVGFISKIIFCNQIKQINMLDYHELYEALLIIFELICERRFTVYSPKMSYQKDLVMKSYRLEIEVEKYKLINKQLSNKLKEFNAFIKVILEKNNINFDSEENLAKVFLKTVKDHIQNKSNERESLDSKELIEQLNQFLDYETEILSLSDEQKKVFDLIEIQTNAYKKLLEQNHKKQLTGNKAVSSIFEINESSSVFFLSKSEIATLCNKVYELLSDFSINRDNLKLKYKNSSKNNGVITYDESKVLISKLFFCLALILN